MEKGLLVRSFGYGILSAEVVPPEDGDGRAEALRMLLESGVPFTESLPDPDRPRIFALSPDGHVPSDHELGMVDREDWDAERRAVGTSGSASFAIRLAMLESAASGRA